MAEAAGGAAGGAGQPRGGCREAGARAEHARRHGPPPRQAGTPVSHEPLNTATKARHMQLKPLARSCPRHMAHQSCIVRMHGRMHAVLRGNVRFIACFAADCHRFVYDRSLRSGHLARCTGKEISRQICTDCKAQTRTQRTCLPA